MSHLTVYKTEIGNVSKQLLQEAIGALAKEIGATVSGHVIDYDGNRISVDIALHSLPLTAGYGSNRGIGFAIDDQGNLVVKGDSYGIAAEYNRVQSLATNYVKAYKVAVAARNNPMSRIRSMNIKPAQRDVIMEVVYA